MSTVLGLLVFVLAGVAAAYVLRIKREDDAASLKDNSYTLREIISPPQKELLFYLEQAFQEHAVLFRPSLAQLVQIQHTSDRVRSQALLDTIHVDYVVCTAEGKIRYAFDIRQRGPVADDPTNRKINTVKQRVLRSVGIKLMGIQRSVSKMPPVTKFAHQLSVALGEPAAVPTESTARLPTQGERPPSASQAHPVPQLEPYTPSPDAGTSEIAMLTDVMGLTPESNTGAAR